MGIRLAVLVLSVEEVANERATKTKRIMAVL
jgi:hypothetical protein